MCQWEILASQASKMSGLTFGSFWTLTKNISQLAGNSSHAIHRLPPLPSLSHRSFISIPGTIPFRLPLLPYISLPPLPLQTLATSPSASSPSLPRSIFFSFIHIYRVNSNTRPTTMMQRQNRCHKEQRSVAIVAIVLSSQLY